MQGMRTVGPHVAAKLCDIVKLRNKLARSLGYEDFYDCKVPLKSCSLQHSSRLYGKLHGPACLCMFQALNTGLCCQRNTALV